MLKTRKANLIIISLNFDAIEGKKNSKEFFLMEAKKKSHGEKKERKTFEIYFLLLADFIGLVN